MKLKIIFLIFVVSIAYSQTREKFAPEALANNAGSTTWTITGTEDDTSAVFDLYYVQSIQFAFTDTVGTDDDSLNYKVDLYTTNQLKTTPDSTFALAQNIETGETTGGWRPVILLNHPMARKGYIVITGLTGNSVSGAVFGNVQLLGWSNSKDVKGMK